MMRRIKGAKGIEIVVVVALFIIVVVAAIVGYQAWRSATQPAPSEQMGVKDSLPQISQKSDLALAQRVVENVNPDSLDTTSIDQAFK